MPKKKRTDLLHCKVLHTLPGRLRVSCSALLYLSDKLEFIHNELSTQESIKSMSINPRLGTLLVYYEHDHLEESVVIDLIESAIGQYSLHVYKADREAQNLNTVNERRLQEEPFADMVRRVIISSVSLLFSIPMRRKPSKSILGRFFTIPSISALSLSGPIFSSGFLSLRSSGRPNADTLSATAILASILQGRDISALTIIWLADIAETLTAWTMDRTRKAIRNMLSTGEEEVWLVEEDGAERRIPIDEVEVGQLIKVYSGEKISVDGSIESGEAAIDEASITGEYMASQKREGENVFAGTVVLTGSLTIRAMKVGDDTAVSRVIRMVEEATHRKAVVQAFADKFSAQFIPVNFALAGLVYFITGKASRALSMLIIDYSCGVRLSTATALSGAIGRAAKHGILIKGSNYLEQLAESDTLIFDKTGTLTEGKAVVNRMVSFNGANSKQVLSYAAAAETNSNHPLGQAVLQYAKMKGLGIPDYRDTEILTARGVKTTIDGINVFVGNRRLMNEQSIDITDAESDAQRMAREGSSLIYVAHDGALVGLLGVQDTLRENMKKALNRLRFTGIDDIILLTGDVEQQAEVVATRMTMDRFEAELLPENKAEIVLKLQSRGTHVVMVGDGINDAPALAYADVGIAMGSTRTDIAIEAADITITVDDPLMIPATVRLANETMAIVKQNFALAIGINTAGLLLSALGRLSVFWGAVLHNASTVLVVGNSARLLLHEIDR